MKALLSKHKTTVTGILTGCLMLGGVIRWMLGQIDAMELGAYAGVVGTVSATVIGLLSKDGNLNKQ